MPEKRNNRGQGKPKLPRHSPTTTFRFSIGGFVDIPKNDPGALEAFAGRIRQTAADLGTDHGASDITVEVVAGVRRRKKTGSGQ